MKRSSLSSLSTEGGSGSDCSCGMESYWLAVSEKGSSGTLEYLCMASLGNAGAINELI